MKRDLDMYSRNINVLNAFSCATSLRFRLIYYISYKVMETTVYCKRFCACFSDFTRSLVFQGKRCNPSEVASNSINLELLGTLCNLGLKIYK